MLAIILLLTNQSKWTSWPKRKDREHRAESRGNPRLIEAGDSEEPYRDMPLNAQEPETNHDQAPIVTSALLQNESDNAWRAEGVGASH